MSPELSYNSFTVCEEIAQWFVSNISEGNNGTGCDELQRQVDLQKVTLLKVVLRRKHSREYEQSPMIN